MFVLDFFTVYPDSVSERIIQKNCLTNIILALSLLPPYYSVTKEFGCHGELMTSQIKIESQNFRCYNQPNIVSRFNSHTIQLEPCSKTSWHCLYQFTIRIPTVKLKIPRKRFLKSDPELLLHSSYSF